MPYAGVSSEGVVSTITTRATTRSPFVSPIWAEQVLYYTQILYPIFLFLVFAVGFVIHGIVSAGNDPALQPPPNVTGPGGKPLPARRPSKAKVPQKENVSTLKRLLFIWLVSGIIATFVGNAANIVVHALVKRKEGWWCGEAAAIYVIGSTFLYSLFLISLVDTKPSPNIVNFVTWVIAFIAELLLFIASLDLYTSNRPELGLATRSEAVEIESKRKRKPANQWEIVELVCDGSRILLLFLSVVLYVVLIVRPTSTRRRNSVESTQYASEQTPLLNGHGNATSNSYVNPTQGLSSTEYEESGVSSEQTNGTVNGGGRAMPAEEAAFYRPTSAPARSWYEYLHGYSLFFPYLWPSKSIKLQLTVVLCFSLVLLQRYINILVPDQIGEVTNELSSEGGSRMPWLAISLLIVFKLMQGPSGLLGAARSVLWIPVAQYSYAALSTASFEHVHGLSLEFHLGKRTGEVLSAMSKGASINTFLEQITFSVFPMLIDLGVAIVYFSQRFDNYYSLTITIVTFWYLYLTIRLAQWRAEQRRQMVNADREEDAVMNDSIQSYETVKYFGAEEYEFQRYRNAVNVFQKAEYNVLFSLNVLNISQNLVFMLGLLVVCFICAYQVSIGLRDVGQFVTLVTYMVQLQGPLNFFGTFYRSVQSAMISGERLLELFKERPSVVDEPGAADLPVCEGQIRFANVKFSYDQRKPALEDLSFTCPPGTTTALVGESGGGKSTVFRLLFRSYNFQDGSIQVDGHDVRGIKIKELRNHIGVVPQDTVLFNETLMYNLRYANQKATDEEIFAACRAASIHDKILTFPDGYKTKVGERGLRLSGGEKQRVAIARTILKNPRIIMLDEATAALDSETEQNIQQALKTLSEGRTILVIAHRLSTITAADQILVLHQGSVAESGTHEELLAMRGRYATMWQKQIRAEEAARSALTIPSRNLSPKSGSINDEPCFENEPEVSGASVRCNPSQTKAGALELAARTALIIPNHNVNSQNGRISGNESDASSDTPAAIDPIKSALIFPFSVI